MELKHRAPLRRRGRRALGQGHLDPLPGQAVVVQRGGLSGLFDPVPVQKAVPRRPPGLPLADQLPPKAGPPPLLSPAQGPEGTGRPLPHPPHIPPAHPAGPVPPGLLPPEAQAQKPVPAQGHLPGQVPGPGLKGPRPLPGLRQGQTGPPIDLPLPAPPPAPGQPGVIAADPPPSQSGILHRRPAKGIGQHRLPLQGEGPLLPAPAHLHLSLHLSASSPGFPILCRPPARLCAGRAGGNFPPLRVYFHVSAC